MSDELDQEELSALGLLEDIAHAAGQEDTAPVEPPPTDEAADVLRRLYVEGLGLLAYDLLPAQPQPGTRATLLAHLVGGAPQAVSPRMISAAPGSHPAPAPARPAPPPAACCRHAPTRTRQAHGRATAGLQQR